MARKVKPMDKALVIKLMKEVAERKRNVAMFNNIDIPLVKALLNKAKTEFNTVYGRSGVQIMLKD